jgi:group I intron endonuclease
MGTIYRIRNLVDGKVYVGQAVNFKKRKYRHLWELRSSRHINDHLQRAWLQYGEAQFVFEILSDDISHELLTGEEQRFLDLHKASDQAFGYNKSPAAASNLGVKYSDASRLKMSIAQKGRTFTDDARRRIAATLTGKIQSAETIARRVLKNTGLKRTAATCALKRDQVLAKSGTQPLAAFGKVQHIRDWAREYGLNTGTLRNRLNRSNMPLEEALTAAPHRGKRKDLDREDERRAA